MPKVLWNCHISFNSLFHYSQSVNFLWFQCKHTYIFPLSSAHHHWHFSKAMRGNVSHRPHAILPCLHKWGPRSSTHLVPSTTHKSCAALVVSLPPCISFSSQVWYNKCNSNDVWMTVWAWMEVTSLNSDSKKFVFNFNYIFYVLDWGSLTSCVEENVIILIKWLNL